MFDDGNDDMLVRQRGGQDPQQTPSSVNDSDDDIFEGNDDIC